MTRPGSGDSGPMEPWRSDSSRRANSGNYTARHADVSFNANAQLSASIARGAMEMFPGQVGMGTGSNDAGVPDVQDKQLISQISRVTSSLRPTTAQYGSGSVRDSLRLEPTVIEAAAARLSDASPGTEPIEPLGPLEVDSVRASESQVESEKSKPLVLGRETPPQTAQPTALPKLPPVGQPAQGHAYMPLPGWVPAPLGAAADPPLLAATTSTGAGVRFFLPEGRPPSAATGVLAARRRLTMRQSVAQRLRTGDSSDMPMASGPSLELLGTANSFIQPQQRISELDGEIGTLTPHGSVPPPAEPTTPLSDSSSMAPGTIFGARRRSSIIGLALAPWKKALLAVMNHIYFYWALVFLTFIIIFEDDVKKACLPPSFDMPLEVIITIIFVLFSLEMALSSFIRPGYFLGFYFWLDAIGTCSLVFEVPTVRIKYLGGSEYINLANRGGFVDNAGDQLYISSKAGRVARIFRLLRMLRLYAQFRQHQKLQQEYKQRQEAEAKGVAQNTDQLSIIEFEMQQERKTRVGQKLEELTTRRIIVGVLMMILLIPAFDIRLGTFGRPRTVGESGLKMLHDVALQGGQNSSLFDVAYKTFTDQMAFHTGSQRTGSLYFLRIANDIYINNSGSPRRFEELYFILFSSAVPANATVSACETSPSWPEDLDRNLTKGPDVNGCIQYKTFAIYDWKWYSQVSAILNIARSLFIIALLVAGAYFLNRDSKKLVLEPIERMMDRVKELGENPLGMAESRLELRKPWDRIHCLNDTGYPGGAPARHTGFKENVAGSSPAYQSSDGAAAAGTLPPNLFPPSPATRGSTADVVAVVRYPEHPGAAVAAVGGGSRGSSGGACSLSNLGPSGLHHAAVTFGGKANGVGGAGIPARISAVSTSGRGGMLGSVGGSGGAGDYMTRMSDRTGSFMASASSLRMRIQSRLRHAWIEAKKVVGSWAEKIWTYLWDGPPEDVGNGGDGDAAAGRPDVVARGAGAYETKVLENSIAKIGALLAIGFGDAGAEVIAENIRNDGDINPMVPGRKIMAIFGFCDIRRFTDTTEVLQEEVMEFVNSIAYIVHTSVSTHGGSPNKNIGDAFLLVWKFPPKFHMRDIVNLAREKQDLSVRPDRGASKPTLQVQVPPSLPSSTGPASPSPAVIATGSPTPQSPGMPAAAPVPSGAVSTCKRILGLGSSGRVVPAVDQPPPPQQQLLLLPPAGGCVGGAAVGPNGPTGVLPLQPYNAFYNMQARASNSMAHSQSLAQLTDEGFVQTSHDGKMKIIRSLKLHNVELNWPEKRAIIGTIADNALASFVLINIAMKRSARLKKYALRQDLNKRMPGFQIAMGFGLHVGWAIEGAIGSVYKIDASYLSPNVNMASRLEAATKQFGVALLLSEDFVECLSKDVRGRIRQIDNVTVKGSIRPMGLYTYDINWDNIPEPTPQQVEAGDDSAIEDMLWPREEWTNQWQDNPDLANSWGITEEFKEEFEQGFQAYRMGDWPKAQRLLEPCRTANLDRQGVPRVDGPSDVLLKFMAEHNYSAPRGWKGFRELTEK